MTFPEIIRDQLDTAIAHALNDDSFGIPRASCRRGKVTYEDIIKALIFMEGGSLDKVIHEAGLNIPLSLLKEEQQKVAKQLAVIDHEVKSRECTFATISDHLKVALDMVEDCGKMYRFANDTEKRMMNQAIFSKIWVEQDGRVTVDFAKPFNTLMEPLADAITGLNKEKIRSTEVLADFFSVISNRLSKFFGNCLNNDFLVEISGIEPLTS